MITFCENYFLLFIRGVDSDSPGQVSASNIQLLRPIPVVRSIPVNECTPQIE